MIRAEHVIKTFTRTEKKGRKEDFNAVDDISLTADEGEIVGILGPNGAGKTTLLRMLANLLEPTRGSVTAETQAGVLSNPVEIKKNIGYLSGNTKLYGRLSVREMLTLFGGIYGIADDEIDQRVDEVVDVLHMEEFVDNRIEKLSTGQTQRASIARCLVHQPDIYIFDEPTLGLDIISSAAIIEFMKSEKEKGKTIIYSTHYMEEAEYLCDRIIMMNHGKLICNASPEELKRRTGTANMREAFYMIIEKEGMAHENESL